MARTYDRDNRFGLRLWLRFPATRRVCGSRWGVGNRFHELLTEQTLLCRGVHALRFVGENHRQNAKFILYNIFHSAPARPQASLPTSRGFSISRFLHQRQITSPSQWLASIGEKMLAWSDPRFVDMDDLLSTAVICIIPDPMLSDVRDELSASQREKRA